MQQEYIDQALSVADSFYNLGFAQGLAFGIFIAFMVYIKVSDWLRITLIMLNNISEIAPNTRLTVGATLQRGLNQYINPRCKAC